MPLLKGSLVPLEAIDPAKHRYIGMWRPAVSPTDGCRGVFLCTCGQTLYTHEQGREHYLRGCFDIPQYVDIEK